jgi:hypothetical protein
MSRLVTIKLGAHWIGTARHRPLRLGSARNGTDPFGTARNGTDPFGTYRNSSGILDRAKRSEGPNRAEGQYLLPSEGFYVYFCSNWFLTPIGSEAVRGRSPDPSRAEPCRADPIQCAPSLTLTRRWESKGVFN